MQDISGLGWIDEEWREACRKLGWSSGSMSSTLRLCTHYGIEWEDIEVFLDGINKIVSPRALSKTRGGLF